MNMNINIDKVNIITTIPPEKIEDVRMSSAMLVLVSSKFILIVNHQLNH